MSSNTDKESICQVIFDRKPCWIEPLESIETTFTAKNAVSNTTSILNETAPDITTKVSKKDAILFKISEIIKNASGIIYEADAASYTFLELGLDSLSLTQLSGKLKAEFDLPITFRQLNEGCKTPLLLADYIELNLPEEHFTTITENEIVAKQTPPFDTLNDIQLSSDQNQTALQNIVQQMQLLVEKVDQLQNYSQTSRNRNPFTVSSKTALLNSIPFDTENRIDTTSTKSEALADPLKAAIPETVNNSKVLNKYMVLANEPLVKNSKLGRDENGNPAWFIEDVAQKGKFAKIKLLELSTPD